MEIFNNDQDVRKVLMQLINGTFAPGDPELFRPLYNSLLNTQCTAKADTYFILKDFKSYAEHRRGGSCLPRRGQLGEERHPECGMLRQVHI